ncbi:hypothetical protein Q5P01_001876 [Channa striata]|uniref:Uncharacterized protein n=1 Tax=Channa striata TaxID=64152 RepID=A0AA88NZL1_CHASR|nr:hypothetical protein Q5P01_001876 [Channa striata]
MQALTGVEKEEQRRRGGSTRKVRRAGEGRREGGRSEETGRVAREGDEEIREMESCERRRKREG